MEYISVTQYAKEAGITRQSVLARIKRGTLKAKKVGTTYIIGINPRERDNFQIR